MPKEAPPSPKKIIAVPLEEGRRARGESVRALPRSKVATLRAFRRIRADRVFGVIGVILIVFATILVFKWEKPPPVPIRYSVEFPATTYDLPTVEETLSPVSGSHQVSKTYTFQVPRENVSKVLVRLAWVDDHGDEVGEGDEFQVRIVGPPGTPTPITEGPIPFSYNRTSPTTPTVIEIPILVHSPPSNRQVEASNEAKARAAYSGNTSRVGMGEWTVTLNLTVENNYTSGPGGFGNYYKENFPQCPEEPRSPYCTPDTGNDFELDFQYITYASKYTRL